MENEQMVQTQIDKKRQLICRPIIKLFNWVFRYHRGQDKMQIIHIFFLQKFQESHYIM